MLLKLGPFAGELPRLASEHLPDSPSFATICEDVKLYSGDLIPYRTLGRPEAGGETVVFVPNRRYTFDDPDVTAILAIQDSTRELNPDVFSTGVTVIGGTPSTSSTPANGGGGGGGGGGGTPTPPQPERLPPPVWGFRFTDIGSPSDPAYAGNYEHQRDSRNRDSRATPRFYAYTQVDSDGMESALSMISTEMQRVFSDDIIVVRLPASLRAYTNTSYRIYRSNGGDTPFLRVTDADIPVSRVPDESSDPLPALFWRGSGYIDTRLDADLGPPPTTGQPE